MVTSRVVGTTVTTNAGQVDAIGVTATIVGGTLTPVVAYPNQLLLQAVVESIGPAPEGSLIQTLEPAWREIQRALAEDPDLLTSLNPRQWEELIAASYDKAGFDEVILTPRSGDLGRDVIAIRRGSWSVRIIDQVKAFSPGHLVTANDVRALLGVLGSDRAATKGLVTTTSAFAPRIADDPFIAPFVPYRLELVDGAALRRRLLDTAEIPKPSGA
jgi:restriction system protein